MNRRARSESPSSALPPSPSVKPPATRVRELRVERDISLDDLALRTNLSVETLEKLEASSLAPTIPVLWRLASALKVPFSALLTNPQERDHSAVQATQPPAVRSQNRATSRSLLHASPGPKRTELCEIKLPAGTSTLAAPRTLGSRDSILVTSGVVIVEADGMRQALMTGGSLDVASDVERRYTCHGDADATLYIVTTRSRDLS